MSVLRRVKLRTPDGTESIEYPLGVEAENVEVANEENLSQRLARIDEDLEKNEEDIAAVSELAGTNKQNIGANEIRINALERRSASVDEKPYYFDTVADMKAYQKLKVGDMAITLGYYEKNDGGQAFYYIRQKTESDNTDGITLIELSNNLVAELVIKNNEINIKQLGARMLDINNNKYDIKSEIELYLSLNEKNNKQIKLYIPAGIWYCSGVNLLGRKGFYIYGHPTFNQWNGTGTIITALNDNQDYIINIGSLTEHVVGWTFRDITLSSADFVYNSTNKSFAYDTIKNIKSGLNLINAQYGLIDNLFFMKLYGEAFSMRNVWEVYFKLLNFRHIVNPNGCIFNVKSVDTTIDNTPNISACNFEKIMFEHTVGKIINFENNCKMYGCAFGTIDFECNEETMNGIDYFNFNDDNRDNFENDNNSVHLALFNFEDSGIMQSCTINNILLSNFSHYFYIFNNIKYAYDTIINWGNNCDCSSIFENITVVGQTKNAKLINMKNINNVNQYVNVPKFLNFKNSSYYDFILDVKGINGIDCNCDIDKVIFSTSEINKNLYLDENNFIPCYKLFPKVPYQGGGLSALYYENNSRNKYKICVIPRSDGNVNIWRSFLHFILNNLTVYLCAKIPNGENGKINFKNISQTNDTKSVTLEGTGEFKIYEIELKSEWNLGDIIEVNYVNRTDINIVLDSIKL